MLGVKGLRICPCVDSISHLFPSLTNVRYHAIYRRLHKKIKHSFTPYKQNNHQIFFSMKRNFLTEMSGVEVALHQINCSFPTLKMYVSNHLYMKRKMLHACLLDSSTP